MTIVENAEGVEGQPAATARERRLVEAVEFVRRVRELPNGERATLRRNAGKRLRDEARNCAWFSRLTAPYRYFDEEAYFLVATLIADNRAKRLPLATEDDFGSSLRRLAGLSNPGGVERRLKSLLDADFDPDAGEGGLPHHLRHLMLRMLSSRPQVSINWPQLLADIRQWNSPNRHVQRRWARSYYGESDDGLTSLDSPAGSPLVAEENNQGD